MVGYIFQSCWRRLEHSGLLVLPRLCHAHLSIVKTRHGQFCELGFRVGSLYGQLSLHYGVWSLSATQGSYLLAWGQELWEPSHDRSESPSKRLRSTSTSFGSKGLGVVGSLRTIWALCFARLAKRQLDHTKAMAATTRAPQLTQCLRLAS